MRYRRFGRTGWEVSEIGYGMWGMAGWTNSNDDESLQSLQASVDNGCNFFDTAYAYGNGRSENLLGQIVRSSPGKYNYASVGVGTSVNRWFDSDALEVLNEDYIRTARAKGLSEGRVVYRHGLRSALTPSLTQLGVDVGTLLGGVIVTDDRELYDWHLAALSGDVLPAPEFPPTKSHSSATPSSSTIPVRRQRWWMNSGNTMAQL